MSFFSKTIASFSLSFLLLMLGIGCKPQGAGSTLQTDTSTGYLTKVDLTTYTGANAAVYAGMKKEMDKFHYSYDTVALGLAKKTMKGSLTKEEAVALRLYTSSAYSAINTRLRSNRVSQIKDIVNIIKAAASGLNKIPSESCVARRGLDLPAAIVEKIIKVKRFEELAFMSTTKENSVPAGFKNNLTFVITSKNCHDISFLSEHANEKEVLFPPGSDFIVTKSFIKKVGGKWAGTINLNHVVQPGFKAITSGTKINVVPVLTGVDAKDFPVIASARPKSSTKLLGLADTGEGAAEEGANDSVLENETAMDFSGIE
ncbi:MAG: hypothetical protein H7249_02175 [Chitinophagaceae bacterium]|nr:hypothetical protein [Oligoflexus sp.]